jgi:hypothetical protein
LKAGEKYIDGKRVLLHAAFWLFWIVSFTIIQGMGKEPRQYFVWLMYYLITLPIFVSHTYIIAYWLLPRTFFKGKIWLAIAGIFVLLVVFSVAELIVSNEIVFRLFDKSKMFYSGYLKPSNIIISGIGNHYIIMVFLAIKVWQSWYYSKNQSDGLLQLKMETELEIYRYQLQPKLILSMVEVLEIENIKEPEKLSQMIVKMSGFLNHFLFEVKDELIPLSLEVKLIREFLDIYKYAIGGRFNSNLIVNGNLQSHICPPLLILPTVNKAVKVVCGSNNSFESTVIIKAEKKYLLFTFRFWSEKDFRIENYKEIEIIKKRLTFNFPSKHRIIESTDANFNEISLEIFN